MTTHHTRGAITLAALIVAAGLTGCPSAPKPFEPMVDAAVQAEMGPGVVEDAAVPAEDAGGDCVPTNGGVEICDGLVSPGLSCTTALEVGYCASLGQTHRNPT